VELSETSFSCNDVMPLAYKEMPSRQIVNFEIFQGISSLALLLFIQAHAIAHSILPDVSLHTSYNS
jgi:hypothetical protein